MTSKKTLLGLGAIALAMTMLGYGVWAVFTDTESTNVALDSGQLDIVAAPAITVTDMAPGDVAFRDVGVDLPAADNDGDLIEYIDVSTALNAEVAGEEVDNGTPTGNSSSLWSDADGVQVVLAACDGGTWTLPVDGDALLGDADTDGLDDSATCSGTIVAQTSQPVNTFAFTDTLDAAALGVAPTATGTIPDGSSLEMIVQLTLPDTADNSYENGSIDFDIVFDAVQRAGINR